MDRKEICINMRNWFDMAQDKFHNTWSQLSADVGCEISTRLVDLFPHWAVKYCDFYYSIYCIFNNSNTEYNTFENKICTVLLKS